MTYACVAYEGFAFDLLRQYMRFVSSLIQRSENFREQFMFQHT